MQFFDDKQEVMDVILTPFGKHLLSQGRFRPEFYAFFDDDILYDSQWITGSTAAEVQNDIEGRIQQNTPRIKPPSVYTGVETSVNIRNELIRQAIVTASANFTPLDPNGFVVQDSTNHKIYNQEVLQIHGDKFDFLSKPLGRSAQSSQHPPAWNVSMLQGQISSSQQYVSASNGIEKIPQLDITLNYKVYVDEQGPEWLATNPTVAFSNATFAAGATAQPQEGDGGLPTNEIQDVASIIFDDGTYFSLQNGKIILEITEENVNFKKENFDIQVFVSGAMFDGVNGEPQQLFFSNDFANMQNDEVEKYLTIRADKAINDARISGTPIRNLNQLTTDASTTNVVSTREFLIRDLYNPEEDICD